MFTVDRLSDERSRLVVDVWFGEQEVTHTLAVETRRDPQEFFLGRSLAENEIGCGDVFRNEALPPDFEGGVADLHNPLRPGEILTDEEIAVGFFVQSGRNLEVVRGQLSVHVRDPYSCDSVLPSI